jgi:hypothetical protein
MGGSMQNVNLCTLTPFIGFSGSATPGKGKSCSGAAASGTRGAMCQRAASAVSAVSVSRNNRSGMFGEAERLI